MKKVKINYATVGAEFNKEQNLIYDLLKINGFQVEISEHPDFLICGQCTEAPFEYCGSDAVRVMVSGENYIPDFNLIDYAISPYPISFGDRHFQLPPLVWPRAHWQSLSSKNRAYPTQFLETKNFFANFISSHESEFNIRGDFFKKLCQYKRVESPGTYLNNMPDGETVNWLQDSKTSFQRQCKFTLCFESTLHYGFVTEKLMDAFYADTIPIYYGSKTASEVFNPKAFINVADYDSFEDAIEQIIYLDQHDDAYLDMLRQPILVNPDYPRELETALGDYVCHIFNQPPEKAYRRSRVYYPAYCDDLLSRFVDEDSLGFSELSRRLLQKVRSKLPF